MKKTFDNKFFKFSFIFMCILAFYLCITHEYGFNVLITAFSFIAISLDYLYVFVF